MRASEEFRREGVEFVVCNNVPEQILCLGLSCRGGGYELISIRSGSGPFTSKVRLSTANGAFTANFSEAFETIGGVSSTRAKISPEGVKAMAASRRISIGEAHPDPDIDRFSSANLIRLIKASKGACPPLD